MFQQYQIIIYKLLINNDINKKIESRPVRFKKRNPLIFNGFFYACS